MKAVLAQIVPVLGDQERNLRMHIEEIRRAERSGADLIVFPELSLTGYMLQDLVTDCASIVGRSPALRKLAEASARIGIVAGFVEQAPDIIYYNSAACFLEGRVAHVHRKVYLPTYAMFDEGRYFGAGEVFRTFVAPWGRTGILVCEDFWHLSSSYLLAMEGMDVLVVVSASPTKGVGASRKPPGRESWLTLGRVVAKFLTCWVIHVNRAGYEEGWNFGGGSFVVDPAGEVLAEARLFEPDRVTVEMDPAVLRKTRAACPMLRDEKLDLVRRELDRVAAARYEAE